MKKHENHLAGLCSVTLSGFDHYANISEKKKCSGSRKRRPFHKNSNKKKRKRKKIH